MQSRKDSCTRARDRRAAIARRRYGVVGRAWRRALNALVRFLRSVPVPVPVAVHSSHAGQAAKRKREGVLDRSAVGIASLSYRGYGASVAPLRKNSGSALSERAVRLVRLLGWWRGKTLHLRSRPVCSAR